MTAQELDLTPKKPFEVKPRVQDDLMLGLDMGICNE
jgi:hypothetical protein